MSIQMTQVHKVSKVKGMNYIVPALTELTKLGVKYEVSDSYIIIKIPEYIPYKK